MDTILAKRNLAKEDDSAQYAIDQSIQRMAISSRETEYSIPVMPIRGDVNLSKLRPLNIISIITKEPGAITEVSGIPDGVKNFKFERQLLIDAPQLPKSLESLNLNGNYIENIDVSSLTKLKVLRLNGNRLKKLISLPESLEELYIDDNQIKKLDLSELRKLRILHCRNNRTLRIENIPASMVDLQVEQGNPLIMLDYAFLPNNVASEEDGRARGTEMEFVESMHDYFRLKTKYENNAMESREKIKEKALKRGLGEKKARKLAIELRPKCVNCKRPVGTVFKNRDERLLAYCGDTKDPCALRIEIFKGRFESDDKFAKYTHELLLENKEEIIRQKMDVLFNYASEDETVAKFKDLLEKYNLYAFLHKTDMEIRDDKRFNMHKQELIKTKLKRLEEIKANMNVHMEDYDTTGNMDSIHSAMDIYIREYMPEINNLRMLRHSVMEMVIPSTDTTGPETRIRILNQSAASMRQLETLHGEVPRIIKFNVGKEKPANGEIGEDDGDEGEEGEERDERDEGEEGEEEIPFEESVESPEFTT